MNIAIKKNKNNKTSKNEIKKDKQERFFLRNAVKFPLKKQN